MSRSAPGERWYRRLLRLYPTDFRDEFGGEMTRLYRDRGRNEPWWHLWGSLLLDLVRTAPSEHVAILRQDLRDAWRALRHTPVITAAAILTLALGVGASTAVFSVVHAVLLRPLPYPEPGALVELFEANPTAGFPSLRASALNYLSWAERSTSFDAIAAFGNTGLTLTDDQDPELLGASLMTASFFQVLRVPAIVGRGLQPEDDHQGNGRVVVLGEVLWRSRFAGDYGIVGRSITLDGQPYRVVGVMPRSFHEVGRSQAAGTAGSRMFLPMTIDRTQENRGNHTLRVVGRLRRGVTLEQARHEMGAVSSALAQEFPGTNAGWGVKVEPLSDTTIESPVQRSLLLALGAVAMVFLIACVNVANLMLARGARRHAELAVRTALGAGRSRLVRQLLTESGCLAVTSGAAGVLGAVLAYPLVAAMLPPTVPRLDEMRLDMTVLAFGLLISVVSGIVFGVVPALRASRLNPSQSLMFAGRATPDRSRARLRQVLIAGQIALATILLVGAALLLQAFVRLQRVPVGFDPADVLTARISLPRSTYADAGRAGQFYQSLVHTLRDSGQVQSAAVATSAPFAPGVRASFQPAARRQASGAPGENGAEHIVSADYFRVLGIPLLAGRSFNERDTADTSGVAIVSQRLARMSWPDEAALGQLVERSGRSYEVVGIVGDVRGADTQGARGGGPDREPRAAIYFAAAQLPQRTMTLLVRPASEPAPAMAAVRAAIRRQDSGLALQQVRLLQEWLAEAVAPNRLMTTLAAIFAMSALLLASIGVFGVLASMVASRTREIGVRMAIGATPRRVMALVLRESMTWAASGMLAGLAGAYAAGGLIAAVVFDVPPNDPATFALVGGVVTAVAVLASVVPVARAVRIDPTIAIRTE